MHRHLIYLIAVVLASASLSTGSPAECYDFEDDPGLQVHVNEGGSDQHYFMLPDAIEIMEGARISVRFIVHDYRYSSYGHSTVWGAQDQELEILPSVRINLHYDQQPVPQFSIYSREFAQLGERFPLEVGIWYRVDVVRHGDTATAELHEDPGDLLFTDTLDALWFPFDKFMVCYDYYGGGYCRWDEENAEIDFRSDRGSNYIEGSIDYVCFGDEPTAAAEVTWGGIKAAYR
jgi:hypothetical protein